MTKYRIKTKEEFLQEYGYNWRECRSGNYFNEKMDIHLGKDVTDLVNSQEPDIFDDGIFDKNGNVEVGVRLKLPCRFSINGCWTISWDMIKKIKTINYNEKKTLVYD